MSIRDFFPGFFPLVKEDIEDIWKNGVIVPDTNILLHLLRHNETTRNELLAVFSHFKAQLWITHRVALEFSRRWRDIDAESRRAYSKIREKITPSANSLKKEFDFVARHQTIDAHEIRTLIDAFFASLSKKIDEAESRQISDFLASEMVDAMIEIFGENVGGPIEREKLESLTSDADERFSRSVPPGYVDFKDNSKVGLDKYGDFLIWKEIIELAKKQKKGILFVSDDAKEDWIFKIDGKEKGLRQELIAEFMEATGQKIYRYPFKAFLTWAKSYSQVAISDRTIEEVGKEASFVQIERDLARFRQIERSKSFGFTALDQSNFGLGSAIVNNPGLSALGQSHLGGLSSAIANNPGLSALGQSHLGLGSAIANNPGLSGLDQVSSDTQENEPSLQSDNKVGSVEIPKSNSKKEEKKSED